MMALAQAAVAIKGRLVGHDVTFRAVTTDSRKIAEGDLFVALKGEHFDGHDFVAQCVAQGAVAAMVEREMAGNAPLLVVPDTRLGLGELAAYWRGKFSIPLAAVTGSNGKTTVKEMLAAILREAAGTENVLATEGNLNNDIGLPLTLLKLEQRHRYAVAEMGMNHPGEISYLTHIAKPSVALINNAQPAHLEGLGNVEAVARAKGEIFEGLAEGGTAIINADDKFAPLWLKLAAPHRVLTFGLEPPADICAEYQLQLDGSALQLNTPQGRISARLGVPGLHNVRNALAATAVALSMGVALPIIATGLERFSGTKGRLQRKPGKNGCTVIDDTYNANPSSMRAAIEVLAAMPGYRFLVLGDMGELGADAAQLHAEIGAKAKSVGIDVLFALGELSRHAVSAFGAGSRHFESPELLVQAITSLISAPLNGSSRGVPQITVLVKGSRFMRMERVVDAITEPAMTEKGDLHAA